MPEELEKKLKAECRKKGWKVNGKRCDKYVYGTLRKIGWKPKRRKKTKK